MEKWALEGLDNPRSQLMIFFFFLDVARLPSVATSPSDGGKNQKKKLSSQPPKKPNLQPPKNSGPKAEAAELRARFLARESRFNVPLPHTSDPESARELGGLLRGVRVLCLDERSSAIGGGTDALAAALVAAAGGRGASRLRELDLAFRPHSWASDLFSDAGLVALARAAAAEERDEDEDEGGGGEKGGDGTFGLVRLRLSGAGAVSDAGLSAAAACSPFLRDFELTGYTELVSDRGISALAGGQNAGRGRERRSRRRRRPSSFVSAETSSSLSLSSTSSSSSSLLAEAAAAETSSASSSDDSEAESLPRPAFAPPSPPPPPPSNAAAGCCSCALERLCLGPRLPRVSDAGVAAVVARAARLRVLRLPGRCTDAALLAASRAPCRATLEEVDASACVAGVTAEGARALVEACPRLRSLRLPPGVSV